MSRPKAVTTGSLKFGSAEVDVYNLDDGRRVISQRAIVRAITSGKPGKSGGREGGNLAPYLSKLPERFRLSEAGAEIVFVLPSGTEAIGRDATWLIKLCRAYDEADRAGELHHTQAHLANQARAILAACAEVGIAALVDEATGYQYVRQHGMLAELFAKALRDEASAWRRTWKDEVVDALCRTFHIQRKGREFPAPLMGVVGKLYRTLIIGFRACQLLVAYVEDR